MAQKTIYADDIDGSEGAEPVSFALRGQAYEIDLSKANQTKLEKALQPFIEKARKGSATRTRSTGGGAAGPRIDYSDVEHAGTPHRGRITDAEKLTVKENLAKVNDNLRAKGVRTIDPNDAEMKKKYDL